MNDTMLGYLAYRTEEDEDSTKVKKICDMIEHNISFEETIPRKLIPAIEREMRKRGKPIELE